jgi:hypothetical protein
MQDVLKQKVLVTTNNVLATSIQQTKQIICNGEGANIEALVTERSQD